MFLVADLLGTCTVIHVRDSEALEGGHREVANRDLDNFISLSFCGFIKRDQKTRNACPGRKRQWPCASAEFLSVSEFLSASCSGRLSG